MVGVPLVAQATDLETWAHEVRADPDFKVRLAAGLRLGGLGDRRAVPILIDALNDTVATVRTVAAGALTRLASREVPAAERANALEALRRVATRDPDEHVRVAAQSALEAFELAERLARPRLAKDAIFVHVEPLTDATGALEQATLAALTGTAREAVLIADDSFLVDWPRGGAPTRAELKRVGARGAVVVIPTLAQLDVRSAGSRTQIECKLSLIIAAFPGKAARVFLDGRAKLDTSDAPAAVAAAKSRCVADIVKHLMGKQLAEALHADR